MKINKTNGSKDAFAHGPPILSTIPSPVLSCSREVWKRCNPTQATSNQVAKASKAFKPNSLQQMSITLQAPSATQILSLNFEPGGGDDTNSPGNKQLPSAVHDIHPPWQDNL